MNLQHLLLFGLHFLFTHAEQFDIRHLDSSNVTGDATKDNVQWSKRVKRTAPAVWGAPVPNYYNIILGPTVYLYTILFIDQKTVEHYNNDMERVTIEIVKLVRESNKYFYQLNIRIVVADVLPTNRNDLSLYSFEDYHNALKPTLPYHDFAVLITFRYAGGLAFVSGFCSTKNVMMTGFYPHNPSAMASIFFHETCHLLGVSHTHANETLDVPNCPCNPISYRPASSAQINNKTGESLVSSTTRHVEGCLKIPGFDHDCSAQLAVNLLHRSRCLSNTHRTAVQNHVEGYTAEPKAKAQLLSICGNGVVEANEECDCGLPDFCSEVNCEPLICQRKIPLWVLILGGIGLVFAFIVFIVLYVRLKITIHSKKQYSAVETKMMSAAPTASPSDYLANLNGMINQLSRLFQAFKSLLCKRKEARQTNSYISTKTKLDSTSIVVVRSAQQLPAGKGPAKIMERPRHPPPALPRPKAAPPPRPELPPVLKAYSQLEQNITYKFADFEEDD